VDSTHSARQHRVQLVPPAAPGDPILLALGFALAHRAMDTAIAGTSDPEHMMANIRMAEERLLLAEEAVRELQHCFDELGGGWPQET
jgi:aryl-alcohol dehydrogenase-like predicted oxidoreductase